MKTALRGISGVAAMTNSTYEDISSIYTTVAGNGKLMTDQLNQLSSRGINAAATLGKQLGYTEAEIRSMTTKGEISFQEFADAMDSAFGDHAKDANNTLTGVTSNIKRSRGFFLCSEKKQLFVFCNYTRLFDTSIYPILFEEYQRFITRTQTISQLSEISATTKEWQQLAETQQSFLPQKIPNIPKLKIATYFRPLVNVSGDYFSILPIDKNRTLLMLGDVSGKGLPAALIMGLVMNTVKIIEDKEDLVGVIHAVDKAIKGMHLQDKYTVLFLGIIDTEKMKIRYINASMSDPIILSPSPDGYRMKPLTSNASLVGILDMGDISVQEKRLFRGDTILIATDCVSEVMDDSGVELGDTDIYKKTLIAGASKSPQDFVNDIVDLIWKYNGDKKLHDDVTMMIAKVGY